MHFKNKKLKPARQTACAKVQSLVLQRKEDSIESRTLLSQQKFHFSQALVKVGKILNRQNLSHTKLQAGMFQRQSLASQHHFSFNIFSDFSSFECRGERFKFLSPKAIPQKLQIDLGGQSQRVALCFQGGGSFPTEKVKRTSVTRVAFCAKVDVFYKNANQGSPIIYKHILYMYP